MPSNRFKSTWIAGILALCLAADAKAQLFETFGPLGGESDMQFFGPVELGQFGRPVRANQGFFFQYERVSWSIMRPNKTPVGKAGLSPLVTKTGLLLNAVFNQTNSIQNSTQIAPFGWGNRFDMGYVHDNVGVMTTIQDGPGTWQVSRHGFDGGGAADVSVVFDDPDGLLDIGNGTSFATFFDTVETMHFTSLTGMELLGMYRFEKRPADAIVEVFYGARFLELTDRYRVFANGGILGASSWDVPIENDMIGPEVGLRVQRKYGYLSFLMEGRFTAAANFQNIKMYGQLGSGLPAGGLGNLVAHDFKYTARLVEFSPVAEVRASANFDITDHVALTVGWTGLYAGNVARSPNMIDYKLPKLGLLEKNNTFDVFATGVNFGFVVNR